MTFLILPSIWLTSMTRIRASPLSRRNRTRLPAPLLAGEWAAGVHARRKHVNRPGTSSPFIIVPVPKSLGHGFGSGYLLRGDTSLLRAAAEGLRRSATDHN